MAKNRKAASGPSSAPAKGQGLKPWQQQALIHLGILAAFYVVVVFYFKPVVLEGEVLNQHDFVQYKGMAHETEAFREETGEEALWTSTLFGGMPAYQTSVVYGGNWFSSLQQIFWAGLPRPANYIFMMFAGFFFLLRVLKVNPWLSAAGAAAFALSSYFFIILDVGHTSKANAIAYMAPLLASILLTYQGKYLIGGALTAFFTALEVTANHYQITYYLLLVLLLLGIFFLIDAIQQKKVADFAMASAILIGAGALGVGPSIAQIWTTMEYTDVTMRGRSELSSVDRKNDDGLDIGYAFRWSYGPSETLNLLIPNLYGGASAVALDRDSDTYQEVRNAFGNSQQVNQFLGNFPAYWGPQTGGTSGPVYVGAIVCFLFVLGLLVVQGPVRWWLLATTLLSFFLAWGRHMMWLNEFLFYYLPIYSKFRAPSMALVIAELSMPLLGFLGLATVFKSEKTAAERDRLLRALYLAAGIVGGLALLFAVAGTGLLAFSRPDEQYGQLLDYIVSYRQSIMRADAIRSFALIAASAGIIFAYLRGQLASVMVASLGIAGLVMIDMVPVNLRYLNEDSYVSERRYEQIFEASPASQYILQDETPGFRVLNLATSTFNDGLTSYHHRSVGGYHAAKLRRYQDLIDRHISQEMGQLTQFIQSNQQQLTDSMIQAQMARLDVLNMLNTRYVILNPQGRPVQNLQTLGAAWYVSQVKLVNSPDEEIQALGEIAPKVTAVVDQAYEGGAFAAQLQGVNPASGANGRVVLEAFSPNSLTYQTNSSAEGVVVFSEIYYNSGKGWQAYLDGEPVPHFRADYVLRGMVVPAGQHRIEFRFEPKAFRIGNQISMVFSLMVLLLLATALGLGVYRAQQSRGKEASS
jgi:hypothetical protein